VHAVTWQQVQVAVLALRRWQLVIKQVNHRPFRFPKESLEKRILFIDPSNPLGLRNGRGSTTTKPTTKPFALSV